VSAVSSTRRARSLRGTSYEGKEGSGLHGPPQCHYVLYITPAPQSPAECSGPASRVRVMSVVEYYYTDNYYRTP
jgi:hypothetical protein